MNTHVTSPENYGLTLRVVEAGGRRHPVHSGSAAIAEIGKEIIFDPDVLYTYDYEGWKPIHHDVLLVSAAVEYADRRIARRTSRWARDFNITMPVVEVATWQRPELQASLRAALRHLTGDDWQFTFVPWQGQGVLGARQRSLPSARSGVMGWTPAVCLRCSGTEATLYVCV